MIVGWRAMANLIYGLRRSLLSHKKVDDPRQELGRIAREEKQETDKRAKAERDAKANLASSRKK